MTEQTITCPKCGHEIPFSDALTEKMRHQLEGEMGKEFKEKEKELEGKAKLLEEGQKTLDAQVAKKLETEKIKIQEEAEKKAAEKVDIELKDLKKTNEDKEKQLGEMRKQELELRQKTRDLEAKEKNMDLEFNRKMDEATKVITAKATQEAEEISKIKLAEKDKKMEQMMKALEEANRKAEQGSMQVQGDAQETDLKLALQNAFISDSIEDVKTGIRGADLVQRVFSSMGQQQGVILWESKNQKAWQNEWIKKLKDDQGEKKAALLGGKAKRRVWGRNFCLPSLLSFSLLLAACSSQSIENTPNEEEQSTATNKQEEQTTENPHSFATLYVGDSFLINDFLYVFGYQDRAWSEMDLYVGKKTKTKTDSDFQKIDLPQEAQSGMIQFAQGKGFVVLADYYSRENDTGEMPLYEFDAVIFVGTPDKDGVLNWKKIQETLPFQLPYYFGFKIFSSGDFLYAMEGKSESPQHVFRAPYIREMNGLGNWEEVLQIPSGVTVSYGGGSIYVFHGQTLAVYNEDVQEGLIHKADVDIGRGKTAFEDSLIIPSAYARGYETYYITVIGNKVVEFSDGLGDYIMVNSAEISGDEVLLERDRNISMDIGNSDLHYANDEKGFCIISSGPGSSNELVEKEVKCEEM